MKTNPTSLLIELIAVAKATGLTLGDVKELSFHDYNEVVEWLNDEAKRAELAQKAHSRR